ncbi:GRP protein, partial [Amia calva]|nr:GRP protein [Amia calva]
MFSLLVLIAVICRVHYATAVPVENGAPLAKIYPRGNHWAVGHLMGKKSIDFPFQTEEGDRTQYLSAPEEAKQVDGYLKWSEDIKNLIRALDVSGSQTGQFLKEGLPLSRKTPLEVRERSMDLKEVTDYLLQALNMKENRPS